MALVLRINPAGDWFHVTCPACLRSGPKKPSRAAAINWWNTETRAIKNPRDGLLPHLDRCCATHGAQDGAGGR